ncbi:hypothetical protein MUK42_02563 [Musa troglodytarum]|uniref:Uncharacterized protein n=1 Tax=Musa troglodytarum TaxID=320322 RepID=A0A9E7EU11_9LILI|nr:hypothetical protein MUK42_02563 [Musa troglodytarum]
MHAELVTNVSAFDAVVRSWIARRICQMWVIGECQSGSSCRFGVAESTHVTIQRRMQEWFISWTPSFKALWSVPSLRSALAFQLFDEMTSTVAACRSTVAPCHYETAPA